jgi:hypothetical protein
VERVLEKDLRSLVVLALGFDQGGKKESEKIVSAWRRYVDAMGLKMKGLGVCAADAWEELGEGLRIWLGACVGGC